MHTCIFNYHDVISIRAEQFETNIISCVSNVANTCPFFIDYEAQKVSLCLVNRLIQVYLDSPLV